MIVSLCDNFYDNPKTKVLRTKLWGWYMAKKFPILTSTYLTSLLSHDCNLFRIFTSQHGGKYRGQNTLYKSCDNERCKGKIWDIIYKSRRKWIVYNCTKINRWHIWGTLLQLQRQKLFFMIIIRTWDWPFYLDKIKREKSLLRYLKVLTMTKQLGHWNCKAQKRGK